MESKELLRKSTDTIKQYLAQKQNEGIKSMNIYDVYRLVSFINQSVEQNLEIIGVRYNRYDGVEFKDTPLSDMFEGGFAVKRH